MTRLRSAGWWFVLTWHQLSCGFDCGFSSVRTDKGAAAWCLACDKTWSRP
jgi:hypothetical protein